MNKYQILICIHLCIKDNIKSESLIFYLTSPEKLVKPRIFSLNNCTVTLLCSGHMPHGLFISCNTDYPINNSLLRTYIKTEALSWIINSLLFGLFISFFLLSIFSIGYIFIQNKN